MDHTNVVHLPTAATNPFIQPVYRMEQRLRRTTIEFPGEYICQTEREHITEREALLEVSKSTALAMMFALIGSMPNETIAKAYRYSDRLVYPWPDGKACESGRTAQLILRAIWRVEGQTPR